MLKLFCILWFYIFFVQPIICDESTKEVVAMPVSNGHRNISYPDNNSTTQEDAEITLQELENNMKTFLKNLYNQAFPYVYRVGLPPDTSLMCLINLASVYFGINKLEPWAFRMIDSSGKLPDGLLEGTSTALGDYDECLDVIIGGKPYPKARKGSYCLLEIKPPEPILNALKEYQINKGKGNSSLATSTSFLGFLRKIRSNPDHVIFRMGICMPSTCDEYDVQDIVDMVSSRLDLSMNVVRCEHKKDHEFQVHEILIMIFLCNVIALSVVGTLIEVIYSQCDSGDASISEPEENSLKIKKRWKLSRLFEILSNFSLCLSIQKLLVCKKEGDALDAVRGIKVLTVIAAIFAHTYALPHPLHLFRFRDTLNFSKFIDQLLFAAVANSSVGVDTFFLLAGFLFIFYRWRLFKKPPILKYILKFVTVNYIRMLAAQVLVVFIFALFPIIGSGPLWHEFVEEPLKNCAESSWMNLLFIQNFLGPYDICLYHTWILATMMQLFLFTSFIVWIMHRMPVIGISVNIALVVIAAIAVYIVTVVEDFPATFTIYFYDFRTSVKYWTYLFVQAYTHLGPFCIGMLYAFCITEYPPLRTKKPIILSFWIASMATCCAIVFGLYQYREGQDMNRFLVLLYSTLHRPAWAMAIGWILYACATDNGGFISSILTWKALIPVERLCYLAYLLHVPLMYYHGGVQRERMFMGHYNQVMCFFSYMIASFILSFICYIFFQSPYQTIESYIFGIHNETIWQGDQSGISTETLKPREENNSRILCSRNTQNAAF